jgi:putative ABC transport system substrate-binding protein
MKMRRRRVLVSVALAAWPHAVVAQQTVERAPNIGVLMDLAATDKEGQARLQALRAELRRLGWMDGENARFQVRWAAGNPELTQQYAEELIALRPDVIVAAGSPSLAALHKATATLPIVFVTVIDPVGAGFVTSEARPGGNVTGFTALEFGLGAKWVQFLLDLEPTLKQIVVLYDARLRSGRMQLSAIEAAAKLRSVAIAPIGMEDANGITSGIETNAALGNCGVIVTSNTQSIVHRDLIISLAAKYRLPAIYSIRAFVLDGGLISYSPDRVDQFRQAATYVHKILKGEKPANLPVQSPIKYELVINLRTAQSLDLKVPAMLMAQADEVLE